VSDPAVARYVGELLRKSDEPHFVFAVSMENHGPWRPGRLGEPDADARDLYLQHLRNSDLMIGALLELGRSLDRAVVLCFYGDHSPILRYDFPRVNPPLTDYFIHSSQPAQTPSSGPVPRTAHALPQRLLAACTATTSPFSDHLLPA
jgi:phosphoglycerol transferase MdoB-like AlkP superfamily enzyme